MVTRVACVRRSDLAASAGQDGVVRFYSVAESLEERLSVPIPGFVNGLALSESGRFALALTAQEHRLGRWIVRKEGRNGLHVIKLPH